MWAITFFSGSQPFVDFNGCEIRKPSKPLNVQSPRATTMMERTTIALVIGLAYLEKPYDSHVWSLASSGFRFNLKVLQDADNM